MLRCALWFLMVTAIGVAHAPAWAQPTAPKPDVDNGIVAVNAFLAQEAWREAREAIDALPQAQRLASQTLFVTASLDRRLGEPRRAIQIYKQLLARPRADDRIRLELAQTYFELGDYAASEHHFRLALGGRIAAADGQGVLAYLEEIAKRRDWRFSVGLALAPDSNINSATDTRTFELLGLPFTLNDDARRRSGAGIAGSASAERRATIGKTRWAAIAQGQVLEYSGGDFDDQAIALRVGPEFVVRQRRITPYLSHGRRWLGGEAAYATSGFGLDVAQPVGPRTYYQASVSVQAIDMARDAGGDGTIAALDLTRTRYMSSRSFWRGSGGVQRYEAEDGDRAYWQHRLAAGYYRDLPFGLGGYLEPSVLTRRYDEADRFFAVRRQDVQVGLSVRLVKQDYDLWGFSPFTQLEAYHTDSNIPIQSYTRTRGQFGFTRTF